MLVLVTLIAVKVLVSLISRESVSTRRRSAGALLLVCLTGRLPSAAHAAETQAAPSGDDLPCSAAGGPASETPGLLDVTALFGEFQCWLAAGHYAEALVALDTACSASDDPACLFNRGLVHHAQLQLADESEAEHCFESRRNYAGYVDVSPYEAPAERARQALLELGQICGPLPVTPELAMYLDPEAIPAWQGDFPPFGAPLTAAPANVAPPTEPDQANAVRRRTTTWLLLGAGAASALAAVVSGIHTKQTWDDLSSDKWSVPPDQLKTLGVTPRRINVYDEDETQSLERRLTQYEVLTWGFGVTAAVLLGIGIGRTVVDSGPAPSLSIGAGPGFGGVSYGGEL